MTINNTIKIVLTTAVLPCSSLFAQNTFPSSGNTGIGTTSPTAKLEVISTQTGSSSSSDNTNTLRITNNRYLGAHHLATKNVAEFIQKGTDLSLGTTTTDSFFLIRGDGSIRMSNLALGSNKLVMTDANGNLGTYTIPTLSIVASSTPGQHDLKLMSGVGTWSTVMLPKQTLSISGSTLSISGGNSVTLPTSSGGDNLGNHLATMSLDMSSHDINRVTYIYGSSGGNVIDLTQAAGSVIQNRLTVGTTTAMTSYTFYVDGSAYCTSTWSTSDENFKENIKKVEPITDKLFKLNSYSYNFKSEEFKGKRNFDNGLHYGFLAQEIEPVFPNLVKKGDDGYYAVNYPEFIPLLLQAVKEQKSEINELKDKLQRLETKLDALSNNTKITTLADNQLNLSILYQNVPNPFTKETTIKFNIKSSYKDAFIGIYDLNGKQIDRVIINQGSNQIVVPANNLNAGTYIYNLVVDGQLIDSKKMILIN